MSLSCQLHPNTTARITLKSSVQISISYTTTHVQHYPPCSTLPPTQWWINLFSDTFVEFNELIVDLGFICPHLSYHAIRQLSNLVYPTTKVKCMTMINGVRDSQEGGYVACSKVSLMGASFLFTNTDIFLLTTHLRLDPDKFMLTHLRQTIAVACHLLAFFMLFVYYLLIIWQYILSIVTGATCEIYKSEVKCSLFSDHLISLTFGEFMISPTWFHPFIIYTLHNLSV